MQDLNVLLEMMVSLQTKAQAYQAAFPHGSAIDGESPIYIDMLQSLKATNAAITKMDAKLDVEARALLATLTKQEKEYTEQGLKQAAEQAAKAKEAAAAVKAALDKVGEPGLPTLPFEEAYSPKASRLQDLIARFSQIGNATLIPRPQR